MSTDLVQYYSVDRITVFAVAVSMISGKAYLLDGVSNFTTAKTATGEAGSFSVSVPVRNAYDVAQTQPLNEYMAVAGPMDLIAIYAVRSIINDASQTPPASPFGPSVPWSSLTYGGTAALPTAQMGTASCIMIGMVDKAFVRGSITDNAPTADFYMEGRDLTKIFVENDTNVPEASLLASQGDPSDPANATFYALLLLQIGALGGGAGMILGALDIMVGKQAPQALPADDPLVQEFNDPALSALSQYGYPWRNFVVVGAEVDGSFLAIQADNSLPPFSIQQGSAWANMDFLRNYPVARLYVNEVGHLVFGDQYAAWVQQDPVGNIDSSEISDFEFSIDDIQPGLITNLSIFPMSAQSAQSTLAGAQGIGATVDFVDGLASTVSTPSSATQKYGNRYGRFDSNWDWNKDQVDARRKNVVEDHNSLFKAKLVVRGNSCYRAGQRYVVNAPAHRQEVANAAWYVESVEHQFQFGADWSTTMTLRFPVSNGQRF